MRWNLRLKAAEQGIWKSTELRRAALSLGEEAGNPAIQGWAHEMRAWFALTHGDLAGVIEAARVGVEVAPQDGVAAQLVTQEAKACAKLGDRRQVEIALERGRTILDSLPYPSNVANHFVVDPAKFDSTCQGRLRRRSAICDP